MSAPARIQLRRTKGWRMPAGAVKVDRSTRWGNPYVHADPAIAVEAFRQALAGDRRPVEGLRCVGRPLTKERLEALRRAMPLLRGKVLACWCALDAPCHGDVLRDVANSGESET